jgi:hypothetical protein
MIDETEIDTMGNLLEFKKVEIINQEILFHHFKEGLRLFVIILNYVMGPLLKMKLDLNGCMYYDDGPFEGYFPFCLVDHGEEYESWSDSLGELLYNLQDPSSQNAIRYELESLISNEVDFLEDISIVQVHIKTCTCSYVYTCLYVLDFVCIHIHMY